MRILSDSELLGGGSTANADTLYLAEASPGKGKTHALIESIPALVRQRKHILIAAPTTDLADDIKNRVNQNDSSITVQIFHSQLYPNQSIKKLVEERLRNRISACVICTHEALRRIDPKSLKGWVLVVDELPKVLELASFNLDAVNREPLFKYTEISDDRLCITRNQKTQLKSRFKNTATGALQPDSTLSVPESTIYKALLDNHYVFADPVDKKGIQAFRIIEINDLSSLIKSADECHLLCATYKGSILEAFCDFWGLKTQKSRFTPTATKYTNSERVTIFPLIRDKKFSASLAYTEYQDGVWGEAKGNYMGGQYIDYMLGKVCHVVKDSEVLAFKNTRVRFSWLKYPKKWKFSSFDSRGVNGYKDYTECVILFSCNANPLQRQSFQNLQAITGISSEEWERRWDVTHTYEMALQDATRTNVREDHASDKSVNMYVPDTHFSTYLKQHMPDAKVDYSLAEEVHKPLKPDDKRRIPSQVHELILELAANGLKMNTKIAREVLERTGHKVSRSTVSKIRKGE